jgi:hypothetical protein
MKSRLAGFSAVVSAALLSAALPALAHHSFSAEFDNSKPVALQGTVTKVDWMNPHIWIYLDVKDDKTGAVASWQCEGGPPNTLTRNGWTKNDLKKGDTISVNGTLAKDASKTCNASSVKFADGRTVFAGSSNPDVPKQ